MTARPRQPRAAAFALLAAATAGLLTGCDDVNASRRAAATDVCAAALPTGQAAAGPAATLIAVRRTSSKQWQELSGASPGAVPVLPPATAGAGDPPESRLCVLAYRRRPSVGGGSATRGTGGSAEPSVVLVLVTTRHPRVVATRSTPSLPPMLR